MLSGKPSQWMPSAYYSLSLSSFKYPPKTWILPLGGRKRRTGREKYSAEGDYLWSANSNAAVQTNFTYSSCSSTSNSCVHRVTRLLLGCMLRRISWHASIDREIWNCEWVTALGGGANRSRRFNGSPVNFSPRHPRLLEILELSLAAYAGQASQNVRCTPKRNQHSHWCERKSSTSRLHNFLQFLLSFWTARSVNICAPEVGRYGE